MVPTSGGVSRLPVLAILAVLAGMAGAPPAAGQTAGTGVDLVQQVVPRGADPGIDILREQQRQERRDDAPGDAPIEGVPPPAPGAPEENAGPLIPVTRFDVSDSAILRAEEIAAVLGPLEGREVRLSQIQAAVAALNDLYRDRGALAARAVLPPQEVVDGVVRIVLVEARIEDVTVGETRHTSPGFLRNRISQQSGDLLDIKALEREIIRFNRLARTRLGVQLAPGDAFGTTDILLEPLEPDSAVVQVFTDNNGLVTYGRARHGVVVQHAAILGRDDPLSVGAVRSEGSTSAFGRYRTPPLAHDLRVDLYGSVTRNEIVGGQFAGLDITGRAMTWGAEARLPVRVDRDDLWQGVAAAERRLNRTTFLGIGQDSRTDGVRVGMEYEHLGPRLRMVSDLLGHRVRELSLAEAADTSAVFTKVTSDTRLTLVVGDTGALVVRLRGQHTDDEVLPPGEQFTLGGAYSLRGYEEARFAGDVGYEAGLEARWAPDGINAAMAGWPGGGRFEVYSFVDHGAARPFRPGDDGWRREDFATDVGAGLTVAGVLGVLDLDLAVAQGLDDVHRSRRDSPRLQLRAGTSIRF